MKKNVIILSNDIGADLLKAEVLRVNPAASIACVFTATQLALELPRQPWDLLLSFSTGVIVPKSDLTRFGSFAVNFHAATPDFPGRDPHHFAHYRGARRYGATAHLMTHKVDAGPIIGVEQCDVPVGARPIDYLNIANSAAERLIARLVPDLVRGHHVPALDCNWGPVKTTRNDFINLCRVTSSMDKAEFERRRAAVEMSDYRNLFVEVHGYRFRIDPHFE